MTTADSQAGDREPLATIDESAKRAGHHICPLAPKTVDLMLSDHIVGLEGDPFPTTGPGYGFGLGLGVRKHEGMSWVPGSVGDAMWAGAGGTSFTIDPREQIVGVFVAAAPTPRLHMRLLFKTLMHGALADQQQ